MSREISETRTRVEILQKTLDILLEKVSRIERLIERTMSNDNSKSVIDFLKNLEVKK